MTMLSSSIRAYRPILQPRPISPPVEKFRLSISSNKAPVSPPKQPKKEIFTEIEEADANLENAKKVADAMLLARSAVIEKLLLSYGKGPYMYQGERVRIVKRRSENGQRLVYFFRALSKTEPEDIE